MITRSPPSARHSKSLPASRHICSTFALSVVWKNSSHVGSTPFEKLRTYMRPFVRNASTTAGSMCFSTSRVSNTGVQPPTLAGVTQWKLIFIGQLGRCELSLWKRIIWSAGYGVDS